MTMGTVYYVRGHGPRHIPHLRFTTDTVDVVSLSPEHLVFDAAGVLRRADAIKTGDLLKTCDKPTAVVRVEPIMDLPLTPVVLSGEMVLPRSSLVSCWSHSSENAAFMDKLMDIARPIVPRYSIADISKIFDTVYSTFVDNHKDVSTLDSTIARVLAAVPIAAKG